MQMSTAQFEAEMEAAIAGLPEDFRERLHNVVFMLAEWPDHDTLMEMECESPYDLLGLYRGWPLPDRGGDYAGALPDTIHLYREPILAYCRSTGERVHDCIVDTVVHEVGHYYGLSDDEMERIEAECGGFSTGVDPAAQPPSDAS